MKIIERRRNGSENET